MPEWKKCPLCGGEIHPEAKRCRHCGRMITPEAIVEFEETQRREAEAEAHRQAEEAEAAKLRAQQEAEAEARRQAEEAEAAKLRAQQEAEAEARRQAEETEAAKLRAQQEAEAEARRQAEEAEAAKLRAQQEAEAVEAEEESAFGGYAVNVPPPPPPTPNPDYGYQQPSYYTSEPEPAPAPFVNYNNGNKPSFFSRYFIGTFFKNYANFTDEASRRNYWLSTIAFSIVFYVLFIWVLALCTIGNPNTDAAGGIAAFSLVVMASMLVPSLALSIRRMHNLGKSGWYILLNCIPLVNIYYLVLIFTAGNDTNDTGTRFKVGDWGVLSVGIAGLILLIINLNSDSSSVYDYEYDKWQDVEESIVVEDPYDYDNDNATEVVEAPALEEASNIGYDGYNDYATDEAEEEDYSDYDW